MARNVPIKILRTTRANLDAQAGANGLLEGEPYLITDEGRLAVGTGVGSYALTEKLSLGYVEGTQTVASSGAAQTVTLDGRCWDITLDADCTISFSAPAGAACASALVLLRQDATSGWAVTWSGITLHGSQSMPAAAGATAAWVAWTPDGGATVLLSPAGSE